MISALVFLCLVVQGLGFASGLMTNYTTTISIEPDAEREYFNFFNNPNIKSPLQAYLESPKTLYVLCRATEFAVKHYKGSTDRDRFRLRRILSLKNDKDSFKIELLLKDERTGKLHDERFRVYIAERNDGMYTVQVYGIKQKRSFFNQNTGCDALSKLANCSVCGYHGICHKGSAQISPWLSFALKTQRALQVNMTFNKVQMLGAHNAFNDRSDGYGTVDDCIWPPPYQTKCIDLANQEFSFTDQLNMGVRAIEIDPWWCFGKIRMSHAHKYAYFGCGPWDREFKDGIREIAEWIKRPENRHEIIRLYLEDDPSHTKGHDELVNGPIGLHLDDVILTPSDIKRYFNGNWPTPFEMQQLGKRVIISTGNDYNHQGKYIHKGYWHEITTNKFHSYPNCTAVKELLEPLRVYSDSTRYGPFWDGPYRTGTILNYMDYLKCGVIYPAADQVNPRLLSTAVFTWAKNEPSVRLSRDSCVVLCTGDKRWHVRDCADNNAFACKLTGSNKWMVSSQKGPFSTARCPSGFKFSTPRNAYEHYQLLSQLSNEDVWINFTQYLTLIIN